MYWLSALYKKIRLLKYNKIHGTFIKSLYASLDANYGKSVRINSETRISSDVIIGDYSYVNRSSSLENCEVGKYCSISSGVYISPYNHNMKGITTHPIGDVKRTRKKVIIGNDVLISLNVIIIEGVHIGDGAVIGAGAVVTHDVGAYEVVGGVPARFLKYRIQDDTVRKKVSELKWWDMERGDILELVEKNKESVNCI